MFRNLFAVLVFLMMASGAHAVSPIFDNEPSCTIAMNAGIITGSYTPTTHAPFQGGPGWTKKRVGPAGACLSDAYITEENGKAANGKTVFVKNFDYYVHVSGGHRMAECNNHFGGITFPEEKVAQTPAPQAVVPPAPVVVQAPPQIITRETTVVDKITKKIEVTTEVICISGNTTTAGTFENGKPACPTLHITAPAAVHMPTSVDSPITVAQTPPMFTAPVRIPPVNVPPQAQRPQPAASAAGCTPGVNCAPLRKTEEGANGNCRIKAGTVRVPECNFPWKVLHTQDDIVDCGCQILIPTPRQIVGFPDAQPGSPRCLQQKKLWTQVQGIHYSDTRQVQ